MHQRSRYVILPQLLSEINQDVREYDAILKSVVECIKRSLQDSSKTSKIDPMVDQELQRMTKHWKQIEDEYIDWPLDLCLRIFTAEEFGFECSLRNFKISRDILSQAVHLHNMMIDVNEMERTLLFSDAKQLKEAGHCATRATILSRIPQGEVSTMLCLKKSQFCDTFEAMMDRVKDNLHFVQEIFEHMPIVANAYKYESRKLYINHMLNMLIMTERKNRQQQEVDLIRVQMEAEESKLEKLETEWKQNIEQDEKVIRWAESNFAKLERRATLERASK